MATIESNAFEIERRSILFKSTTTLPDLSALGFDNDPNIAVDGNTDGETLIYNTSIGSGFIQQNGTMWDKTALPNTWVIRGLGGGSSANTYELFFGKTQSLTVSNVDRLSSIQIYDEGIQPSPYLFNERLFGQSLFNQTSETANCEVVPLQECYFPARDEYNISLPEAVEGRVLVIGSGTTPTIAFVIIPPPDNLIFENGDNIIFENADNAISEA